MLLASSGSAQEEEEVVRLRKPERPPRRRQRAGPVEEEEALTSREHQVLSCFAEGLNTPTTVRNHAQRILSKLHVHSRLEAVAHGYATGLLSVSAADPEPRAKGKAGKK
ncbi:MAG: helix-turn-helix transcriptional regulator [Acidobacteriota bacterium]